MRIIVPRAYQKRKATSEFRGRPLTVTYTTSPVTGNLFATGKYDGEPFLANVNKGEKRGTIGGSIIVCDAVGRRDYAAFAHHLAVTCKFNRVVQEAGAK